MVLFTVHNSNIPFFFLCLLGMPIIAELIIFENTNRMLEQSEKKRTNVIYSRGSQSMRNLPTTTTSREKKIGIFLHK